MTIKKLNQQVDALLRELQARMRQRKSLLRADEEADTETLDARIRELKIRVNRLRASIVQKQKRRNVNWSVVGQASSMASAWLANRQKQESVEGLGMQLNELMGLGELGQLSDWVPMGQAGVEFQLATHPATGQAYCVHHDGFLTGLDGVVMGYDPDWADSLEVEESVLNSGYSLHGINTMFSSW
ncbi:MAG: hypothetical protein LH606_02945 [Cytophagaceae bacterium]|nr:hypothetical protein [Cytophagaceae bacterium]